MLVRWLVLFRWSLKFNRCWYSSAVKKFVVCATDRMFGTVNGNFQLFLILPFIQFFYLSSQKIFMDIRKFHFAVSLSSSLVTCGTSYKEYMFLALFFWSTTSPFLFRATYIPICFDGTEILDVVHSDKKFLLSLTMLVISVLGFLPWCKSDWFTLNPVCILCRNIPKAPFILSEKPILSLNLSTIKIFSVRKARSAALVPVRSLCGLCPTFCGKFVILFRNAGTTDIWFLFSATPRKIDEHFWKFRGFFRSGWYRYRNFGSFPVSIISVMETWFAG